MRSFVVNNIEEADGIGYYLIANVVMRMIDKGISHYSGKVWVNGSRVYTKVKTEYEEMTVCFYVLDGRTQELKDMMFNNIKKLDPDETEIWQILHHTNKYGR